jgi:putative ABC transport system ATP-binding protein
MPPILEARDLTKTYRAGDGEVHALRGVSLAVQPGEFLALMGPSGSGKTTLLQLLGGLDRPSSGDVVLDGVTISTLGDDDATRLRREKTGFVFQSFNLVPLLSARENVALPFLLAGGNPRDGDARSRVDKALRLVDLESKADRRPDELAFGEQQRVAIARAIAGRPAILFADEPTGNLDYATGIEILQYLYRSCAERAQTVVLVTHDAQAGAYADRVLFLRDGRVLEEILLGRRPEHPARPLIERLALLGQ